MYSVNGVPLDNASMGWSLLAPSDPLPAVTYIREEATEQGRDGVLLGLPAVARRAPAKFVVETPRARMGALLALFGAAGSLTYTGDASKSIEYQTGDVSPVGYGDADSYVDVTIQLGFPGVFWRGQTVTSAWVPASASTAALSLFSGLGGPVQDALIRIRGPITGAQVMDTAGSFLVVDGTIPAGTYMRYDYDSGRAWLTTADTWSGGTEFAEFDYGGPRECLEITPRFPTPSDPTLREGRLVLSQSSFSSPAGFQVRGRPAFVD